MKASSCRGDGFEAVLGKRLPDLGEGFGDIAPDVLRARRCGTPGWPRTNAAADCRLGRAGSDPEMMTRWP